jgi:gluconolactonase
MKPTIPLNKFEIFAAGLDHPEGLAFDAAGNLWAGGERGQIYRITPRGRVRQVTCLGGFCLGLTFSSKQELYVCNMGLHTLQCLTRQGKVLGSIERVEGQKLKTPNFSVFDSAGNLYFSDSGDWGQANGWVYCLRASGKAEVFAGPFAFPNGLALSADERHLFIVQSLRDNVLRLELRADGRAGKPHVYVSGMARVPDGLAFDTLGNLYVTCYASDNIYKVTPKGKASLFAYDPQGTMLARPTNAAFGGPDSDQIYFANLGRWHICRAPAGVKGQPLVHQR